MVLVSLKRLRTLSLCVVVLGIEPDGTRVILPVVSKESAVLYNRVIFPVGNVLLYNRVIFLVGIVLF